MNRKKRMKSMFELAVESEGAAPDAYWAMLGLPLDPTPAKPEEYAAMFKGLGENPTAEEVLGAMRRHMGTLRTRRSGWRSGGSWGSPCRANVAQKRGVSP